LEQTFLTRLFKQPLTHFADLRNSSLQCLAFYFYVVGRLNHSAGVVLGYARSRSQFGLARPSSPRLTQVPSLPWDPMALHSLKLVSKATQLVVMQGSFKLGYLKTQPSASTLACGGALRGFKCGDSIQLEAVPEDTRRGGLPWSFKYRDACTSIRT
jgi:hypothetical protein